MMRPLSLLLLFVAFAAPADAHVGSPDLFYNGKIGDYAARVTVRMPRVIPGRAEIAVRLEMNHPVEVSFLPLYAKTDIKNAPPPEIGHLVKGETNLYSGELWLMSFGAYSVEVRIKGEHGDGSVQIPLTSVATRQLPMPTILGNVLAALGCILVIGAVAIAFAAAREAGLSPVQVPAKRDRRNGLLAAGATMIVLTGALFGGRYWWNVEESAFRENLREGAWPEMTAEVKESGNGRTLHIALGKHAKAYVAPLIPDHGKLMHLFLIREGSRDAFAHVHPVRKSAREFEVALPPLGEGRYRVFADLSYEGGTSSTATALVVVPAEGGPKDGAPLVAADVDPDDSWATYAAAAVPAADDRAPVFKLPDGTSVAWKAEKPLRVQRDASLRFEIRDPAGKPVALEPYMGMLSHAAVLRADGAVFAHLHPSGNYSMAAQSYFADKFARESGGAAGDSTALHHEHMAHGAPAVSSFYLPYEFPEPGDYRIWVQFKCAGRIFTAAFDARAEP